MPPKRRKLSLDEIAFDGKMQATDNEVFTSIAPVPSDDIGDKPSEVLDKDRKSKPKTEISSEVRTKEDTPKPTRISERLNIKRKRLGDAEEADSLIPIPVPNQTTPRKPKAARQAGKQPSTGKKNKRRPWAQWSVRDQKLFFIGIGEFGKNFEAVSHKISHSAKQRGLPLKDKMQVRYFYYRCWAKISKFIHLNDKDVKMKTPELYGLINYGVLKNHVKENDPQFGRCLNEMILHGETTYTARNVRGKRTRVGKIRTPVCTYLKKINRIEDKQASEAAVSQKIPHQVTLELTPRNSKAWAKVQGMSQNPRVRFKLTANRTLESVFKYLDKKWKSRRVRLKESLGATEELEEELVCFLHPSCKITPVKLIPLEQEKVNVTFTSYRENILPMLQKLKKSKVKEAEKSNENKDKAKIAGADEQGKVTDSSEIYPSSKPKESEDLMVVVDQPGYQFDNDPRSAFMHLLTTGPDCPNDPSGVGQAGDQFAQTAGPMPSTVVMEDENAMFPDSSPFSPPSSFTETSKASVIAPSSPSSESSLPHPPASVISSPTVGKKKSAKSSKKAAEDGMLPLDNCDNIAPVPGSDSSSSATKTDPSASTQELKENLEKEIVRITTLTSEGFTLKTSNTITLLHLSLILGRESVIRLEYEWRERRSSKVQRPLLCQAEKQMSNVLRRLCNLATLELMDLFSSEKAADHNRSTNKNVPCSHCGREGSAKSRSKRQTERKESTREMATMTDPAQVFQQNTVLSANGTTFVGTAAPQGSLQIAGPDPVFRVPFTPAVKPASSREEQLRLEEQQRLQLQAKAIMLQGPSCRNRLLKKRTLNSRTKKTPPIIVQRTLLPKVSTGQMVAYIQQPGIQSVARPMVVEVTDANLVKMAQPVINMMTPSQPAASQDHNLENYCSGSDLLALAAQSAEINANCLESPEKLDENAQLVKSGAQEAVQEEDLFPMSMVASRTTSREAHPGLTGPVLNGHGDLTISDFDISMSSVSGSNLGPDAGDKFLDMVLQNSEQGFSGLISTPKKLQSTELHQLTSTEGAASFDPSILRTPPHHTGISNYLHLSSIFPSPIKLSISNRPWISMDSGDLSLSSVLGEPSPVKSGKPASLASRSYAALFETSLSDVCDTSSIVFSKPSLSGDLSLSSMLGEPSPMKSGKPALLSSRSYAALFETSLSDVCDTSSIVFSKPSLSGDLSLSSMLGEPSPMKSGNPASLASRSYAALFETSSSDVGDISSIVFSKPSLISDISFGSLLGDSTLKKDDPGGVLPPSSTSPEASLKLDSQSGVGFFSAGLSSEGPPLMFSEASQDSFARLEVERAVQGMVNDSSMDFVSKFEFLAAHITGQQDRELCFTGEKPEKLLGGSGNVESALQIQGQSTAS